MKFTRIKLNHVRSYCLPILALVVFGLKPTNATSQNIQEGTKFFMVAFGWSTPPPNNRYGSIDTLKVIYQSNDTTHFYVDKDSFLAIGEQVYSINGVDSTIVYDYSLEVGDTFDLKARIDLTYSFVVDSVKEIILENDQAYKHFYLSEIGDRRNYGLLWVEGLGELEMGWGYRTMYQRSHYPGLNGICFDDDLIYWSRGYKDLYPTCEFDSMVQVLSSSKTEVPRYSIYPNPATNYLNVQDIGFVSFEIFNVRGVQVSVGDYCSQIEVANLSPGAYILYLTSKSQTTVVRFIKN